MKKFTLGADPELFLYDTLSKRYIPSNTYFQGGKNNPEPFGQGYAVLCDNLMVEFNIPPSDNKKDFIASLNTAIEYIRQRVPNTVELHFNQSAKFDEESLNDESSKEFGCAAQENIYGILMGSMMDIPENIRFAGGHIHFGTDEQLDIKRMVTCFDIFLGIPMFVDEKEEIYSRADIYGNPGTYRETSYGFEYRTPSNEWLQSNDRMEWVYNQISKAVKIYSDEELKLPSDEEIFMAFQTKGAAKELMETFLIGA